MADPVLGYVLQVLDFAVVEWLPDGTFRPFTDPPNWFKGMAQWSSLPFMEHFLPEAEAHWQQRTSSVLTSGTFIVENGGTELLLRARALLLEGRKLMAIERLTGDADTRPILREARQRALEHEAVEDRAREVHRPTMTIVQGLEQLAKTPLTPDQQGIVAALQRAVSQLQAAAATLPPPRRPLK